MNTLFQTIAIATITSSLVSAATVSMEIASQRGVQINAPQQWLQLLDTAGVAHARLRGMRGSEAPSIDDAARGVYHIVAVLDSNDRLLVPGGPRRGFSRRDRSAIADYVDRLKRDGPGALTAERAAFGLTAPEFEALLEELSEPLGVSTEKKSVAEVLEAVRRRMETRIELPRRTRQSGEPLGVELRELSLGTSLALALNHAGFEMRPERPRGGKVRLVVHRRDVEESTGRLEDDKPPIAWPLGYDPEDAPGRVAPEFIERTRVVVAGVSLHDVVEALRPKVPLPLVWDTPMLKHRGVDPREVQVEINVERKSYKRILEKLLFQARLAGELRVDEAGTPFYLMGSSR